MIVSQIADFYVGEAPQAIIRELLHRRSADIRSRPAFVGGAVIRGETAQERTNVGIIFSFTPAP